MTFFSWQMAEELAAEHMRSFGFPDARRTPAGTDGGLDVVASHAVAQVKHQSAPVGGPVVQQLRGAAHGWDHALFYASGGYTAAAIAAADATGVALFAFTVTNDVIPVNAAARDLTFRGHQDGDDGLVDEANAALRRVRAWVAAIRELIEPGPSSARADLGEGRLTQVADALHLASTAAAGLQGHFDGGIPTVTRVTVREAIATSNVTTDSFAVLIAGLPEPWASRFGELYTEQYLELAGAS